MFSKGIRLVLAVALVLSLLTMLGATINSRRTASAKPLEAKLLRRHNKTRLEPTAAEVKLLRGQALPKEERQVEDKIPKHVPIKIKIRSDKEKAFKDLQNDDWLRDLELEVTNTSDKSIYFLEIWADLPEIISESGRKVGFSLRYGRNDFIDFDARQIPEDVPIRPGESHTFTIAENYQRGWKAFKARGNKPNPRRLELTFVQLSFGDGTGFNGTSAEPYPYKRDQSRSSPCPMGPKQGERMQPAIMLDLLFLRCF